MRSMVEGKSILTCIKTTEIYFDVKLYIILFYCISSESIDWLSIGPVDFIKLSSNFIDSSSNVDLILPKKLDCSLLGLPLPSTSLTLLRSVFKRISYSEILIGGTDNAMTFGKHKTVPCLRLSHILAYFYLLFFFSFPVWIIFCYFCIWIPGVDEISYCQWSGCVFILFHNR